MKRIMSLLLVLCALMLCMGLETEAVTTGICGENLTWSFEESTGTLTISGTGAMESYQSGQAPWYSNSSKIKRVVLEEGITTIGNWAFSSCSNLTEVTLAASVKSIGMRTFSNCGSLSSITLPEGITSIGNYAFYSCAGLSEIDLPDGISEIGLYAFSCCRGLKSLEVPAGIASFGEGVFSGCTGLESVTFAKGIKDLGTGTFSGCTGLTRVNIPESVAKIGSSVFSGCSNLADITISEGVADIGQNVFHGCSSLTDITLPNSLKSIGVSAFQSCTGLKSITIPNSVTTLGAYAFYSCKNLEFVALPSGITKIAEETFYGCASLKKITIPNGVTLLGSECFYGCSTLTGLRIPDTVTTIGSGVFIDCTSLESITIPAGVTKIHEGAFFGCEGLDGIWVDAKNTAYSSDDRGVLFNEDKSTLLVAYPGIEGSYTIPSNVTSIANFGFYECKNLKSVAIPSSVTTVGSFAFYDCGNLTDVYYTGSATQWNRIQFGTANYALDDVTIHYNAILQSGTCGENLTWSFEESTGILNISGTGAMESYQGVQAPWYSNSSKIKRVVLEEGITTIGDWAFSSCSNLIEAVLPASLKEIGFGAFDCCEKLKSITIPEGVTAIGGQAFAECNSLTEVEIPGSVRTIGKQAFSAISLENVTLNEGLVSIGEEAFVGCCLSELTIPSTVKEIGAKAFSDSFAVPHSKISRVIIPEGVTTIGKQAFWNCEALEYVSLPSTLTSLGNGAFGMCPNLTQIELSADNQTYIMQDNVILTSDKKTIHTVAGGKTGAYSIPETVTSIADYAFTECVNLTQITIPNSVETVGIWAFNGSSSLTEVTVPDSLEEIPYRMFACCDNLKKVTLPDTITSIASEAFAFSGKLEYVNIPDSVRELGSSAFRDCASLDGIRIPEGIATIKDWTFAGCASLTKIEIPASVTSMEVLSFRDCDQLSTVVFDGNAPWIASNVFWNTTARVYYPKNNSTWTTAKRKDYGGTLTWIAGSLCDAGHTEVVDAAVEAGCEDTGLTEGKHCSVCGKVLEAQVIVPATGHSFGKWVKTSKTEERRDCGNCDHYETREIVIVPLEAPVIEAGVVAATGKPRISWTAASGADFYRVYRADKKTGEYKYLKSTRSTGLTDTTAVVGKNYYYKVCSVKEEMGERSDWSNIVNRCCDLPAPEVILTVKTATGKPVVTWGAVNGAVKYRVYRSEKKDKGYSLLKTTSAASCTDTTAVVGVNYYYKVKAIHSNSAADSAYSEVVNRVCDLAKPEITITLKNGAPRITWKQIPGTAKYRIYRADSKSGTFELVKTAIVATGFTDTDVKSGNTYYYKVRAIHENTSANSAYSSVKYITVK